MTLTWSSNDWPSDWVDADTDPAVWTKRATVVIPAYNDESRVEVLLGILARQTYPSDLTEVIVVDDGSDPPLRPTIPERLETTTIRQERDGFGAARARNLGAEKATGDFIVFLDSDMLPEPGWLEHHARTHHHCPWLVCVGPRTHVDRTSLDAQIIRSGSSLSEILGDAITEKPAWISDKWSATDDGRLGSDIWTLTSSGNLSVSREAFEAAGGFDEIGFPEWGGEDNELGYRLYQLGTYIVPVHSAMAWHLGPGTNASADIEERRRRIKLRLAPRISDPALPRMGTIDYCTPDVAIDVKTRLVSVEAAIDLVHGMLMDANEFPVSIRLTFENTDEGLLAKDYFAADSRITVEPSGSPKVFAPVTVATEADVWPPGLIRWLTGNLREGSFAMVRVDHSSGPIMAWNTRILNQTRFEITIEGHPLDKFGLRTSWSELLDQLAAVKIGETERHLAQSALLENQIKELSNRRSVRWANAMVSLVRSRSMAEARRALGLTNSGGNSDLKQR